MILRVYSFSRASTVMRHKPLSISGGVFGWFESRLIPISEAVHLNVRSRAFAATVHRSNPDSKLLLTLPSGERYIYNETLRWQPRVPDDERGLTGTLFTGRRGRISFDRD